MKIALVEDDINMRKSLEIAISDYKEFDVKSFKNAKDAYKNLDNSFDLVITDINMPGMNGLEFVKELNGRFEVIIITGNATLQRAIESIKLRVKDFLLKPFDIETLVNAIKRSYKVQKITSKRVRQEDTPVFIGCSEVLKSVKQMAKKAAKTDATVLLLGESGVGKELFAQYIHKHSPRGAKTFVAINMAAIPEHLIESELFGFVKGSFTDAHTDKMGKFEVANGGTIFLDEIAEMPYSLQAKLLRILQEREVIRIGSTKAIKIDIRIISATNANLQMKIDKSLFREDLYYRLNTVPIDIPPLRQRIDEILTIAMTTLEKTVKRYELGTKVFSKKAQEALLDYKWPGNIRQLISVVERASILSVENEISVDDLFLQSQLKESNIASIEKNLILEVLQECSLDLDKSAHMLSMNLKVLESKIKKYSISV